MAIRVTSTGVIKRTSEKINRFEGACVFTGPVTMPTTKVYAFTGANAGGGHQHITLTGAKVGDRVKVLIGFTTANTATHAAVLPVIGTAFEAVISVADQIMQNTTDYSTVSFIVFLESVT